MYRLFLFFVVSLIAYSSLAQYTPENLGPRINSSYHDINPVISSDGNTLFFVRVNHPENTYGTEDSEDIWYAELQPDGAWSEAKRIAPLNIGRYNAVMSVSSDGNTLLLNGIYNKRATIWKKRGLSISTRAGNEWSKPQKLKVKKLSKRNRGLKSSGMMSADEKYIVLSFSRAYNSKKTNLFVCIKNEKGKWERPRPIKPLNSNSSEDTPFLSTDGKTLYFASDYETEQYEIYKVTRMGEGWSNWSTPEKVSDVNTSGWEAWFKTNEKGSWGYYASSDNSMGGADIFRIKLFEDNPLIAVSGKIVNAVSLRPLIGKDITIQVNGAVVDSVEINRDSASYSLQLRAGKKYELTAHTEYYKPIPETVDLSGSQEEGTEVGLDLPVEPLPYVLVKGKIVDKTSGVSIPGSAHPRIQINNMPVDSVQIDSVAGEYTVKLRYGTVYTIAVEGDEYNSLPATLDLTNVDEYRELDLDLQGVKKSKPVVVTVPDKPNTSPLRITGRIIDQRTGEPLSSAIAVSVKVEGDPNASVVIDPDTRIYQLVLPGGSQYTLSASADNYYPVYENVGGKGGDINRDLIIVPIEEGQMVRLNNIFFDTGRSSLKKESFPELNRITEFLKENPKVRIEIGGHTDNVGNATLNRNLSEARAKSVASYIVSKGVSSSRLISKGYGLTMPVASNSTVDGRAKNRRVEFAFLTK